MRLGIGATDSMWPKKRRIRLRVLKAVAILRPRRFKGGRNTRCFLGAPGPPAVRPIRRRGPLVGTDPLGVRSDKEPSSFINHLPILMGRCPRSGRRGHELYDPSAALGRHLPRLRGRQPNYLSSTLPPSPSILPLSFPPSPLATPSLP